MDVECCHAHKSKLQSVVVVVTTRQFVSTLSMPSTFTSSSSSSSPPPWKVFAKTFFPVTPFRHNSNHENVAATCNQNEDMMIVMITDDFRQDHPCNTFLDNNNETSISTRSLLSKKNDENIHHHNQCTNENGGDESLEMVMELLQTVTTSPEQSSLEFGREYSDSITIVSDMDDTVEDDDDDERHEMNYDETSEVMIKSSPSVSDSRSSRSVAPTTTTTTTNTSEYSSYIHYRNRNDDDLRMEHQNHHQHRNNMVQQQQGDCIDGMMIINTVINDSDRYHLKHYYQPGVYTDNDVLLGRGGHCAHHHGNQEFLKERDTIYHSYQRAMTNDEKRIIQTQLIQSVYNKQGRFMMKRNDNHCPEGLLSNTNRQLQPRRRRRQRRSSVCVEYWQEVTNPQLIYKIALQALREGKSQSQITATTRSKYKTELKSV